MVSDGAGKDPSATSGAAEPQAEEAAVAARLGLPRRRGLLHPLAARSVDSARVRHAGREQDGFSLLSM